MIAFHYPGAIRQQNRRHDLPVSLRTSIRPILTLTIGGIMYLIGTFACAQAGEPLRPDNKSDGFPAVASMHDGSSEIHAANADGSSSQRLSNDGAENEISARQPSVVFTRISEGPHVSDGGWSFGVSWVDYDGDDYPDIFVNNDIFGSVGELNFLYHNNGDGTYTRVMEGVIASEGSSVASTWADFDGDGDNDVYVSCFGRYNYFYHNNGDGTFAKDTSGPLGTLEDGTMEAEWVDYNNDGRLDLFVVNHRPPGSPAPIYCALYLNTGGTFTLQDNSEIGLIEDEGNSTAWGDYDNDGDRDLFWSRNEKLTLFFDNDGDGTFTQNTGSVIAQTPRKYHGNWADYDNDGDLDLYTGAGYPDPPCLLENTGDGNFVVVTGQQIAEDTGYWTGGYWGDYDNDGWLDLLVLGHYFYEPYPNRLYHNNGDGTLSRETSGPVATDEESSSAAVWADHDRDGDLDLFIANVNNGNNTLYENQGNSNHWIHIRLEGRLSNRSGIGAKIRLNAMLAGEPVWQMREISAKTGFMSQSEPVAHFGLGNATVVDSIRVEWPSGYTDTLLDLAVDQFLVITEGQTLDIDGDGVIGFDDNCPFDYNPEQTDGDGDGIGDSCDSFNSCGDASGDSQLNIGDPVFLVNYIFKGGPAPDPLCWADADSEGSINIADAVYLINFIFKGGPPPSSDCCSPDSFLEIPFAAPAEIDGIIDVGEWDDAVQRQFVIGNQVAVTVMIKHDGANLLAAYLYYFGGEESLCFPEVLIDAENDKSENWMSDDWWFHVSGTDCEANGTYDIWDDCSVEQPDWEGVPNFEMVPEPPILDTFELRIPFTKLGVGVNDTLGLAIRVESVPSLYGYWPPGAAVESPATWAVGILKP